MVRFSSFFLLAILTFTSAFSSHADSYQIARQSESFPVYIPADSFNIYVESRLKEATSGFECSVDIEKMKSIQKRSFAISKIRSKSSLRGLLIKSVTPNVVGSWIFSFLKNPIRLVLGVDKCKQDFFGDDVSKRDRFDQVSNFLLSLPFRGIAFICFAGLESCFVKVKVVHLEGLVRELNQLDPSRKVIIY